MEVKVSIQKRFGIATEMGSTNVRVGSDIFGKRPPRD